MKKNQIVAALVAGVVGLVTVIVLFILTGEKHASISEILLTNVSENSATVLFTTDMETKAEVIVINGEEEVVYYDERDMKEIGVGEYELVKQNKRLVHHFKVSSLSPEQSYEFKVNLDGKEVVTEVMNIKTTEIPDSINTPDPAYGQLFFEDESKVEEGVVVFQRMNEEEKSQLVSAVVSNGSYTVDTNSLKAFDMNNDYKASNTDTEEFSFFAERNDSVIKAKLTTNANSDQPVDDVFLKLGEVSESSISSPLVKTAYAKDYNSYNVVNRIIPNLEGIATSPVPGQSLQICNGNGTEMDKYTTNDDSKLIKVISDDDNKDDRCSAVPDISIIENTIFYGANIGNLGENELLEIIIDSYSYNWRLWEVTLSNASADKYRIGCVSITKEGKEYDAYSNLSLKDIRDMNGEVCQIKHDEKWGIPASASTDKGRVAKTNNSTAQGCDNCNSVSSQSQEDSMLQSQRQVINEPSFSGNYSCGTCEMGVEDEGKCDFGPTDDEGKPLDEYKENWCYCCLYNYGNYNLGEEKGVCSVCQEKSSNDIIYNSDFYTNNSENESNSESETEDNEDGSNSETEVEDRSWGLAGVVCSNTMNVGDYLTICTTKNDEQEIYQCNENKKLALRGSEPNLSCAGEFRITKGNISNITEAPVKGDLINMDGIAENYLRKAQILVYHSVSSVIANKDAEDITFTIECNDTKTYEPISQNDFLNIPNNFCTTDHFREESMEIIGDCTGGGL